MVGIIFKYANSQVRKYAILVITAAILILQCNSCIVILLELSSTRSSHILHRV